MNSRQSKKRLKKMNWGDIQFKWNKSSGKIITDKGFGERLNKDFARELLRVATPYTPYSKTDYGGKYHMFDMVRVTGNESGATITYTKPYAKTEYYDPHWHYRGVHKQATSQWLDVAFTHHKQEIIKALSKKRKDYSK